MTAPGLSGGSAAHGVAVDAPAQFAEYAEFYDLLYRDKDYPAEARFIANLLERFFQRRAEETRILDLACGTGRHSQELARMGYSVEGSDISPDMVALAADSSRKLGVPIRFHNQSFQTSDRIAGSFDAVTAMFSAINYLTEYADFRRSLANIRGLLAPGGVFIFDFWNGNAVLAQHSPTRAKQGALGGDKITRTSTTVLDRLAQIATVDFEFTLERNGKIVREFSETHRIRYFFPREMADLLAASGFELAFSCPFMNEAAAIQADDWNLTYVARPA